MRYDSLVAHGAESDGAMMLEKDATPGTKLHVLISSCFLGKSFKEVLDNRSEQSSGWWDATAMSMMRRLGASVVDRINKEDEGSDD